MSDRKHSILVVDDSPDTLEILQRNLSALGYRVDTAPGAARAIEKLNEQSADLVITDLKMPGIGGIDLIRHIRENLPGTAVMMITGYATVESAVEAVRTGAEEFLVKPFTDRELAGAVSRIFSERESRRIANRETSPVSPGAVHGIIGESPAIRRVLKAISKIAESSATVLITGETGVGKELVARAIHYSSRRASAPFVPVNCGAIPEQLVESELFGHTRGAFTGAVSSRQGFFQAAEGGTIFLDEISELSAMTQVKLLRVLQGKEVLMVGSNNPIKVDVRVLAASNQDLKSRVNRGLFREDLFFRLSVINLEIPPLRDRGDDILLLINHLTEKLSAGDTNAPPRFSAAALAALKAYRWPGNVRELENVLSHLIVMHEGDEIEVSDLPPFLRFKVDPPEGEFRTLNEVEQEHIRRVLSRVDGNKSKAARILGIDRKTLREKLKADAGP